MPWIAVPRRGRKPGRLTRWRSAHREPLFAWTVGALAMVLLLGLLFVLAHKLA
ncbi:MAG: hypothetical protein KGO51_09125 [Alphaproteobacteria bacterium]|nr:hypothetical protein [Alphaproteobacteria bacterium]